MPENDAPGDPSSPEGGGSQVTAGPWSTGDVIRLGTVDSTNRYALDAVRSGRGGGFVVRCDHQSAGRGRRGRGWSDPPGGSVLCSVLFRPRARPETWPLLSYAVAGAALEAIEATTGIRGALKWPNDLVIGDRKVAGILAEVGPPPGPGASPPVVVGIGINVAFPPGWLASTPGDDAQPIAARATTLLDATGVTVDPDLLFAALLVGLDRRIPPDPDDAFVPAVLAEVRARCGTIGRSVRVEVSDGVVTGRATGITDTGRLEVEIAGERRVLDAGDVVHLR